MKNDRVLYTAAAILCGVALVTPTRTQAARKGFNLSINGEAENCAGLKVRSTGEIAQTADSFTMRKSEAPLLELNAVDHGQIRVLGWDRQEYSVEACKIAVAETRGAADQMVRSISVSHSAGRLSYNGPASDDAEWTVYFIIHAPKDATLDLEARNGPIAVRDITGNIKVRATNGPIALQDCTGNVDAHTTNGPIAFKGSGGDVRLNARNGPIALNLAGDAWNGAQLEARTINGPLAVSMSDNYRSGVRIETSGHAPISCSAAPCRTAWTDTSRNNHTIQMNGSSDVVRLSTENGPVAVHTEGRTKKIL